MMDDMGQLSRLIYHMSIVEKAIYTRETMVLSRTISKKFQGNGVKSYFREKSMEAFRFRPVEWD